jgi:hypothetical protein
METPRSVIWSSSSLSRAPKTNPSLPTQSRQRSEPVLLTYNNGDGRWRANGGEVAHANLGDGASILCWISGPGDGSDGGRDGLWSSSKQKPGAGRSGEVG